MTGAPGHNYRQYVNEIIQVLVRLMRESDETLAQHAELVSGTCVLFLRHLGTPDRDIEQIYLAALLHDLGKIYLPAGLLQAGGDLSEDDMALVRQHPEAGAAILANLAVAADSVPMIRFHHEHADGTGYPEGLRGSDIPFGAGVIGLVNSYCAMTAEGPGRTAMSKEQAIEKIQQGAGRLYDARLANHFVQFLRPDALAAPAHADSAGDGPSPDGGIMEVVNGIIEQFKKGAIELPVLPGVVHEVQKVIRNPIATTDDLARVIERDSVISLKLIATANSPLYRATKKITTVAEAVPRMGLKQTQSIVSAIASKALYNTSRDEFTELMQKLWRHSLATAYAARAIAKALRLEDVEKFFLLGLVHDVGKVLLLKALTGGSMTFALDEILRVMQDTHTSFGGVLLERWGFGREFSTVARAHEGPSFSGQTMPEVLVVSLANMLTRTIGYSLFDDADLSLAGLESAQQLKIEEQQLAALREELVTVLKSTDKAF